MCFLKRLVAPLISLVAILLTISYSHAQIVINEMVQDQVFEVDTRDFIELYNAGSTAVDLSDWSVVQVNLEFDTDDLTIPIPSGAMLAAGDYYVIGNAATVANVDFDTAGAVDFEKLYAGFELRDASANTVDALALYTTFNPHLANIPRLVPQVGGGVWGQTFSSNFSSPSQSISRYLDGRDTNNNGRDFGFIPMTPGTSNNLPQVGAYVVPDVDALTTGSDVAGYSSPFVVPKVVDPTVAGPWLPHVIPASPQGGKALAAWDNTSGGSMVASDSLVDSFDLYAYLDTASFGVAGGNEASAYGIGTTDPFFATPDPTGSIITGTETDNGSTGVGWFYQRDEDSGLKSLFLVDFNDGGDSLPAAADWTIIQTIDLSSEPSAWHRLGVDIDPGTGNVVARYDDQTFNFVTSTDAIGTFYAGYRFSTALNNSKTILGPPIFDMYVAAPTLAGDFDMDGDVDGNDFLVWQRNTSVGSLSDWQANYGKPPLTATTSAVPEPSTALLFLMGSALVCLRVRS